MERARIDDGLELPGDPIGLGAGPHEACALPALTPAEVELLILDHIGEDLVWSRTELEPLALVGAPGMKELGPHWTDALPAAAVLFLDHRSHPAPVVAWDGNPMRGLVRVADSLDALT